MHDHLESNFGTETQGLERSSPHDDLELRGVIFNRGEEVASGL